MGKFQRVWDAEAMKDRKSLSHVRWDCKYHVVFVSKYRQRSIYGGVREKRGGIIRNLSRQKGIELLEGHAMPDHIHLLLSIPPKFSVANTVGFIKGKSTIRIHRQILGTKWMTGLSFWQRVIVLVLLSWMKKRSNNILKTKTSQTKNN